MRFWRANPHAYGPGKLHAIEQDKPAQLTCGIAIGQCPGQEVTEGTVTCLRCAKALALRRRAQTARDEAAGTPRESLQGKIIQLRSPCVKCGAEQGRILSKNGQDCVWCVNCGRHAYNAPRCETGRPLIPMAAEAPVAPVLLDMDTTTASYRRQLFVGPYETEHASVAAFDLAVERTGLFDIHREIRGRYLAIRPEYETATPRIDRLLVPRPTLVSAGWDGVIGVECKKSGGVIGPAVCQVIDYTWAEFELSDMWVRPSYFFLWPLLRQVQAIASVMDQNRIGSVYVDKYGLNFGTGYGGLIRYSPQHGLSVNTARVACKTGSR